MHHSNPIQSLSPIIITKKYPIANLYFFPCRDNLRVIHKMINYMIYFVYEQPLIIL